MGKTIVITIIMIHMVLCLLVGIGMRSKKLLARTYLYPAVVMIPFWGFFLFLIEEGIAHGRRHKMAEIGLDTLKIQDVKYKRIEVDEQKNRDITVPLEEAMVVNEAPVTRRLMMDILHQNPGEYIELLQAARNTDDTELAHYATTTMLEVQGRYEARINQLQEQLKTNPDNITLLRKCRKELTDYIGSSLLSGKILTIYQNQLDEILLQLCRLDPGNHKYATHYIENRTAMEKYDGLEEKINALLSDFPEEERVYQAAVDYYWNRQDGKKIQEILALMEERKVYQNSAAKRRYSFWRQNR